MVAEEEEREWWRKLWASVKVCRVVDEYVNRERRRFGG